MSEHLEGQSFALSLSQKNILDLERSLPGTSVNNISTTVRIKGQVDFPVLQESIHRVLENDISLGIRLDLSDAEPKQYYVPYVREDFPVFDFSNTSKEGIENWELAVTREPIPLEGGPLYRFILFRDGESSGGLLVKLHHIVSDGWTQIMLCNKIGQTYLELLSGKEVSLEVAPGYHLHVQEEQEYLASRAVKRDANYWEKVLEKSGEPSVLKAVSSAAVSPVGRRMSFQLPQILNHAIYSYCMEKRVAPFAVFYMALAIYFKRVGGAERFTIGVPIFNRTNYKFKQSSGMFVTTLPFYNEIDDEWSLNQFNEKLMESWYEMLRHQRYPFSEITKMAGRDGRLFHIALSYQDSKIFENRDASVEFTGRWHYCGYQAEQLTIHLTNLKNHQQYAVDYDYLAQFFAEEEIIDLHNNLCEILNEALTDPDKPIYRLRVLSMEQKEQLLYTFNQTDRYLEEMSVYEALVKNSSEYQNRVAVICDGQRVTYGAFLYKSAGIASVLSKCGVQSEDLIAIMLPRKTELLAAMVGSLQAGCAYLVLSEELPVQRVKGILQQSGVKILITNEINQRRIGNGEFNILTIEEIESSGMIFYAGCGKENGQDELPGDKLAYVVYTSGSQGEPKGVEITQRNLLNLAQEMKDIYGQGAVLSVCNVGFDAFMLESIVALLNGRTIVLPGDEDLEAPERLAALINGHAVGFMAMTPSRLSAFLQNRAFGRAMQKVESIVCGGEAFPAELLKKLKRLSNARIYNQYGPSETTVAVSVKELSHAEKITAGRPMGNCRLYVLDRWMNPLPAGGFGHLYVGGKCVGRGYRNKPELTREVFKDNPFVADEKIYYTGDVASWTADGEIILSGRLDEQVKLRGLRVELQEISSCIQSYPGITAAVARICELGEQQVIGLYYCADEEVAEQQILAHAATYLPRYMLPSFMIRLDEIPMNANGKVDENKLPLPDAGKEISKGELSDSARMVLEVFSAVLHRDDIHGNSDYFLSGGNSLNAMECVMNIEARIGRKIRIADLYACRTAVRVGAFLDGGNGTFFAKESSVQRKDTWSKAPKRAKYPLSPIQQGMYIQSLLDPSGLSYNMPGAFLLEEQPDETRLKKAFEELITQEPIFRTVFKQDAEGIFAYVQESVSFDIDILQGEDFEQAANSFLKPFELGKGPLLRAALWQDQNGNWYLFLDSHHIIGDGMSTPLILKRLDLAYQKGCVSCEWNYYDYIHFTEQADHKEAKNQMMEYWAEHLKDLPETLVLPGDYVRPAKFDYKGNDYEYLLSKQECEAYDKFCNEKGVSGFVLFLAAYGVLLSAISGKEDFVIGAPVAGRNHLQTSEICGPFINTLPLRLRPEKDLTVSQWMDRVQEEVTGMLDHQLVSLEEIIQQLKLPRGVQNALYQVMLTQSPVDEEGFTLDGKKMVYRPISTGSVKMDLVVEMARKNNAYALRFSYATGLFEEETIHFYARCYQQILKELSRKSNAKLGDLKLLSQADYQKYIETPNYEVTPFVSLPIHKLLANKAQTKAEETAIIYHDERISYGQLERRASRIAEFLEQKGIKPGQCVGLCLSRTPDMVAAMYGVLKCGGAYVFMLPTLPTARISYMLETSESGLLLYDAVAAEKLPAGFLAEEINCQAYLIPAGESDSYVDRSVGRDQIANVLFTSGSTGKPKGVMLRHRALSNMYSQLKILMDPIPGTVLCSTNSVFDCFVTQTIVALAMGRTIVLADEEEMMLPWKLAALIEKYQTGIFEMTPSRLQMCLGNDAFCKAAQNIKIAMIGGEVMTKSLAEKFCKYSDGILMNMYGPTESTVYTTMGRVHLDKHITIGKPFHNIRTYVLNEDGKPVIPTAYGELYIAGECLAAGYISRPDLTESAFVEDIYFPGEKMYKSGDIVRLRVDGNFEYIGRKDAQVKLNGQRVELGEITGAILDAGCVAQAAVLPVQKEDGSMELYAFYEKLGTEDIQARILEYIGKILPKYMIPSHLIEMEHIPITATNKIDVQALKAQVTGYAQHQEQAKIQETAEVIISQKEPVVIEQEIQEEASAEPVVTETVEVNEAYVLSVWNRVLSVAVTETNRSFFELGGTSMGALNVLSHYFNDRLEMTLAEFYENPTAEGQKELLLKQVQKNMAVEESASCKDSEITTTDKKNVVDDTKEIQHKIEWSLPVQPSKKVKTVKKKNDKAILVTGATGFFGAHLVQQLLSKGCQVVCLLRDGNAERLYQCLEWYFGQGLLINASENLKVVQGDISKDYLGMSDRDYIMLTARIGEIYHCAADVRHYSFEEEAYMATNVDGTANMLAFARLARASFYYMSTCSVSGDHMKDGSEAAVFTENDYDIGQIWEENIYVRSKFQAEGLVLEAMEEGMDAKIFRLGRLVGRASDGVFQRNPQSNVFYLIVKAFTRLGVVPEKAAKELVDLMPIDISAEEVLALKDTEGLIYHVMSHEPPKFEEVLKALDKDIRVVSDDEFSEILEREAENMDKELAALLVDHWHRSRTKPPVIHVTNELTVEQLKTVGYIPQIPEPKQVLKGFCLKDLL